MCYTYTRETALKWDYSTMTTREGERREFPTLSRVESVLFEKCKLALMEFHNIERLIVQLFQLFSNYDRTYITLLSIKLWNLKVVTRSLLIWVQCSSTLSKKCQTTYCAIFHNYIDRFLLIARKKCIGLRASGIGRSFEEKYLQYEFSINYQNNDIDNVSHNFSIFSPQLKRD